MSRREFRLRSVLSVRWRELDAAQARLADGALPELAAEELRLAHAALSEITGQFSTEDLLGRIFAGFCIGK